MTTIQQLPAIIKRAYRTRTNVHITGNPGIGKTDIINQTADELRAIYPNFKVWYIYTPSMSPMDFFAYVPDVQNKQLLQLVNAGLPNAYTDPDAVGIVFEGERDNADPSTNKPLLKYNNGEDMGGLRKPDGVIVVSDSNCLGHKSGVLQQPLSLLSRSRNLSVECDPDEFLSYLNKAKGSSYVQAYLSIRKENVDGFAKHLETKKQEAWANPRAWFRLSKSLLDAEANNEIITDEEIIGDIGESVGKEFIGFMYAAKVLVPYETIKKNPKKAKMPDLLSDVYAVIAMCASSVTPDDLAQVKEYIIRFQHEQIVLFHRLLVSGKSSSDLAKIAATDLYREWVLNDEKLIAAIND